jgi:hypothetical protein
VKSDISPSQYQYQAGLTLSREVKGEEIVGALRTFANSLSGDNKPMFYQHRKDSSDLNGPETEFELGLSSGYPYQRVRILADDNNLIQASQTYSSLTVKRHIPDHSSWGFDVAYTHEDVETFVNKVKEELETLLQ